jgi:hypothetical protein
MDHVKSQGFWFLLLQSSQNLGVVNRYRPDRFCKVSRALVSSASQFTDMCGFQTGCRPDGSCKVSMVLVSSTSQLTEVWGFQPGYRPDGSCKVSRALVSSTPQLIEVWGLQTGCRPDGSCKFSRVWFLLLSSSQTFGGSKPGVDLMDHVMS